MTMINEPTLPGNPNRITINQHVLPKRSIDRFTENGQVNVRLIKSGRTFRQSPRSQFFCAKRVWNQPAEQGYMKRIEDAFQVLAERILVVGGLLKPSDNKTVSDFHSLWRLRSAAKSWPPPDVPIRGVMHEKALTKAQEENLEKNGCVFSRGSIMPSRHIVSIRIQVLIGRCCPLDTTWSIVRSTGVEFIVPDSFGDIGVVPLNPNCCLVANSPSGEILSDNAIEINRMAVNKASMYYFARDLTKCGV